MTLKFTARQQTYIRKRTKVHDLDPSEAAGELNIVPFLDIVTNIIMFLLATTAYVLTTCELDAHLPTIGRGGGGSSSDEATLNLSVTVTERGIIVAGSGGKLQPGCHATGTGNILTVSGHPPPTPPSGTAPTDPAMVAYTAYWRSLTQCLVVVHGQFPDEHQVILTADPNIEYGNVVAAMDAVREDGTTELFPDVMLSAGVR
jgi:biopolymer transport protein TolR